MDAMYSDKNNLTTLSQRTLYRKLQKLGDISSNILQGLDRKHFLGLR
jgi:hypothetical protein